MNDVTEGLNDDPQGLDRSLAFRTDGPQLNHEASTSAREPECVRRLRPVAECSTCVLRLLLGLTLKSEEAVELLAETGSEPYAAGLRDAAVLDRLIASVRLDPRAADRLSAIIAAKLVFECRRYERCSVYQLAELWATQRHLLSGRALAALVWTIGRRSDQAFRKLELYLTKEIEVLAIRSLAEHLDSTASASTAGQRPRRQPK